jgi:hypothetical protein
LLLLWALVFNEDDADPLTRAKAPRMKLAL